MASRRRRSGGHVVWSRDPDPSFPTLIPNSVFDVGTFIIANPTQLQEDPADQGTYIIPSDWVLSESSVDVGTYLIGETA